MPGFCFRNLRWRFAPPGPGVSLASLVGGGDLKGDPRGKTYFFVNCEKMKKSNVGMTLVEVVLATVLVAMVGTAFGALYATSQRYLIQTNLSSTAQGEASFVIEHIRHQIVRANRTVLDAAPGVLFRFDPGALVAATPGNLNDDQWAGYRYTAGTQIIEFYANIAIGANSPPLPAAGTGEVIGRQVTVLTFTRPNNAEIGVDLTVTKSSGGGDNRTTRLQTIISPRGVAQPQ